MNLPKLDKAFLLSELSKFSLILAVASALPYAFGDVANALGPTAKKAVAITALSVSALSKITQWTIQLVTAYTGAPVPPVVVAPLVAAPTVTIKQP